MRGLLFLLLLPITCLAQKNYTLLLKDYMQEQVNEGFTGAVLIVKNDKVLLRAGYGMANVEWNIPNGPGVKYRLGSVSKQFTAVCIMKLAEEGKLQIDDQLSKYVPDFPKGDSVTIRMLLNHTSGIVNTSNIPEFGEFARLDWSKDSIIHYIEKKPYYFSPGFRFDYCNTGYFLLAYIVEKASGEAFGHYLSHHILDPLDLHDTGVDIDDSIVSHRAQGYKMMDDELLHCVFINMDWLFGEAQVYSTIDDLYHWEKAYTSNVVLKEASRKLIFAGSMANANYGFGIRIDTFMNHALLWHTGDIPGFDTYVGRFEIDGTYVILLSNDQFDVQRMKDEIGHILFDSPDYFAAQKRLFTEKLSAAQNERDKKNAIWHLNQLKALAATERQATSVLSSDTGTFGNFYFFVRGNELYCRGAVRDNNLSLLKYITGDLYQFTEYSQVQFVKNATAQVIGLKLINSMGYEDYIPTPAEMEKNRTTWRKNSTNAGQRPMPDSAILATYAGTYEGGLVFFRQGSEFICRNAERGNALFPLRYISDSLYQLDENVQVEFEKGQEGTITAIKMLWRNGTESIKDKTR